MKILVRGAEIPVEGGGGLRDFRAVESLLEAGPRAAVVGTIFFFSSRRGHTRYWRDWSSDVCYSDLERQRGVPGLDRGVVQRRAGPAHRLDDPEPGAGILEGPCGVFAAAVGVQHDPVDGAAADRRRSEERRVGKGCR